MFKSIEVTRLKRKNYISWKEYFMNIAILSAQRSKDPSTQVGACIVNPDNKIVGVGYNGFPNGCSDSLLPWSRDKKPLDSKYLYVVHAEANAIMNSTKSLQDCTLYCTLFPCNECGKLIIQSGIKKVYALDDIYFETDACVAARRMFDLAKIDYMLYKPQRTIVLKE